jgi:hypothetical protein
MTHFEYGYGWTHSLGNHHSHQCNKPTTGHHNDATMGNRMEGKSTITRKGDDRELGGQKRDHNKVERVRGTPGAKVVPVILIRSPIPELRQAPPRH